MALPAQSYVWFRIRHVAGLWVLRETGLPSTGILYDGQNMPRPPLPYVGLTRREFPFYSFDDEFIREVTTELTINVTAAVAGQTVAVVLFGNRYAYTLAGLDDAEAARDALLALISEDLCRIVGGTAVGFQPCTAAGVGATAIDFAGLGLGPVNLIAVEGCTITAATQEYRHIQAGLRRAVIRFDLYWPTRQDGFDTIDEYAEALRSSLLRQDTAEWLAARGLGVEDPARINVQDTSAVSGGASQRRKTMDVVFNAMSKIYREPNAVEGATPPTIEISA